MMVRLSSIVAAICFAGTAIAEHPDSEPDVIFFKGLLDSSKLEAELVNGVSTNAWPDVAALVQLGTAPHCTATLVGCTVAVTAAHCIADNASSYAIFLQRAGFVDVVEAIPHERWVDGAANDIGLLRLRRPVPHIPPRALHATRALSPVTTIIGYGQTEGRADDFGVKREGAVQVATCPQGVASDTTSVCWRFADTGAAPGMNSNTCYGDSGGPLMSGTERTATLAGVTSGGLSRSCRGDDVEGLMDRSYDTRLSSYIDWLRQRAGGPNAFAACEAAQQVLATAGRTDEEMIYGAEARHVFEVPDGAAALVIAVNGSGDDLYELRLRARPATAAEWAHGCEPVRHGAFAACTIERPIAGLWEIAVHPFPDTDGADSAFTYQLNATALAAAND